MTQARMSPSVSTAAWFSLTHLTEFKATATRAPASFMAAPPSADAFLGRYSQQLARRRYRPGKVKIYRGAFRQFLTYHAPRESVDLCREDVLEYLA